jgi:hypothetical protein
VLAYVRLRTKRETSSLIFLSEMHDVILIFVSRLCMCMLCVHGSCVGHGCCKCVSRLLPSPQRCTVQREAVPFGHVMTKATHVTTRGILLRKVGSGLFLAQVMAWSATMLACCGEASSAGPRPPAPDPVTWAQLWLHRAPVSKDFGNAVRGTGTLSVRSWAARVSSGVAE